MNEDLIKKENAEKALAEYSKILSGLKLKEGTKYSADFTLNLFPSGDAHIDTVRPAIYIDFYALSPLLSLDCFSGTNLAGTIYFAKKDLILDVYDIDSILDDLGEHVADQELYDIKLFNKTFIKNNKLKEVEIQQEITIE